MKEKSVGESAAVANNIQAEILERESGDGDSG